MIVGLTILLWLKGFGSFTGNLLSGAAGALLVWWLATDREKRLEKQRIRRLRQLLIDDIQSILKMCPDMIASYESLISYYDKSAKDPTKTFESDSYALWLSGIFDSINFSDLRDVVGEDKLFEVLNFYKEVKHCYEFRPTKIVKEAAQEKYQILNSPSLDQLMQNANFSHIDSGAQKQA
jgi:hypothetical protein